jgi:cobalt-precorrin-5B (C1)-methyltransferase
MIKQIFTAETTESALGILKDFDQENNSNFTEQIYQFMANRIEHNAQEYIKKHSDHFVKVGAILFDRKHNIIALGNNGQSIIENNNLF